MTKHDSLVTIATECWKALNPLPVTIMPAAVNLDTFAVKTKSKRPAKTARSNSVSSADIPLAKVSAGRKGKAKVKSASVREHSPPVETNTGATGKGRSKGKGKAKARVTDDDDDDVVEPVDLDKRFTALIKDDKELYLRVLRYEVSCTVLTIH